MGMRKILPLIVALFSFLAVIVAVNPTTRAIAADNSVILAHAMTAVGDMIFNNAGLEPRRLPIGSEQQVLRSVGGIPSWSEGAPATAVFASTPVAGTNVLVQGYNIPAPTATANHKVFIGGPTPTPGASYEFYNASASTLQLAVPTVATMNGATQGGYLSVATKLSATCIYTSGTNADCRLNVNPTPAGP